MEQLAIINQEVFAFGETAHHLSMALKERQKILICVAFHDTKVIGYKIGFQERPKYFESWRGGVLTEYRGRKIAQDLLRIQHEWCIEQGFAILTTVTNSNNIPMLIVNLRGGFEIVGTFLDRRKIVKVMLQKQLLPSTS